MQVFTAKEARERRLRSKIVCLNELSRVLSDIERVCYLADNLPWDTPLRLDTIAALEQQGYYVERHSINGHPYTIHWGNKARR